MGEFNCYGKYSCAEPKDCLALNTIDAGKEKYICAFKAPTLRNVAEGPPLMHAGQFKTIAKVLAFYQYPFDCHLHFDLGTQYFLAKSWSRSRFFFIP